MACPPTPSLADRIEEARVAMLAGNIQRANEILQRLVREERADGLSERGG
jgi:hypothetical protein